MLWHPKHKVHFIGVLLRGTDQEIKILTKASVQSQGHMMLLGSGAGISKACEPLVIISLDLKLFSLSIRVLFVQLYNEVHIRLNIKIDLPNYFLELIHT